MEDPGLLQVICKLFAHLHIPPLPNGRLSWETSARSDKVRRPIAPEKLLSQARRYHWAKFSLKSPHARSRTSRKWKRELVSPMKFLWGVEIVVSA